MFFSRARKNADPDNGDGDTTRGGKGRVKRWASDLADSTLVFMIFCLPLLVGTYSIIGNISDATDTQRKLTDIVQDAANQGATQVDTYGSLDSLAMRTGLLYVGRAFDLDNHTYTGSGLNGFANLQDSDLKSRVCTLDGKPAYRVYATLKQGRVVSPKDDHWYGKVVFAGWFNPAQSFSGNMSEQFFRDNGMVDWGQVDKWVQAKAKSKDGNPNRFLTVEVVTQIAVRPWIVNPFEEKPDGGREFFNAKPAFASYSGWRPTYPGEYEKTYIKDDNGDTCRIHTARAASTAYAGNGEVNFDQYYKR